MIPETEHVCYAEETTLQIKNATQMKMQINF